MDCHSGLSGVQNIHFMDENATINVTINSYTSLSSRLQNRSAKMCTSVEWSEIYVLICLHSIGMRICLTLSGIFIHSLSLFRSLYLLLSISFAPFYFTQFQSVYTYLSMVAGLLSLKGKSKLNRLEDR